MNNQMRSNIAGACLSSLLFAIPADAQFKNGNQTTLLDLPRVSQRSVVTQRIGLTDVTITYHRPQVNGRTIFGDVVPYDRVWRAGANDNTTIEFTDAVSIEGQSLAAGRYGLHAIPGKSEWTLIFSTNSTSWGSFSYDKKEDALRIRVKPTEIPMHDLLTYEFLDLKPDAATIALEWERTMVPAHLIVDTKSITVSHLRNELRHLPGFKGEAFFDAALYCVDNQFDYPQALEWINRAIGMDGEQFDNLDLKAQVLDGLGRRDEAAALQARALNIANPQQLYEYGARLLREKRVSDAKQHFTRMTTEHPDGWLNWVGLARAQAADGDSASAKKSLEQALDRVQPAAQKDGVRRLLERLAAGQKIG
jgi:tetratricopeptide (TPR) repeat protein